MHTGHIEGMTRYLGAPRNWDVKVHGHCGTIPIRDEETTAGYGMTSAWFPTLDEIARIASGAPVYLTIIGRLHPPVAMSVGPSPDAYTSPDWDAA